MSSSDWIVRGGAQNVLAICFAATYLARRRRPFEGISEVQV